MILLIFFDNEFLSSQKQRFSQLAEKEKQREAVTVMRRFDEVVLNQGKTAFGEVDWSNLEKTYAYDDRKQLNSVEWKLDYKDTEYKSYVFLVHRTRGMDCLFFVIL